MLPCKQKLGFQNRTETQQWPLGPQTRTGCVCAKGLGMKRGHEWEEKLMGRFPGGEA